MLAIRKDTLIYHNYMNWDNLYLPGFHAFTGYDFNPSFFKKANKMPYQILKEQIEYQKALKDLRNAHITGRRRFSKFLKYSYVEFTKAKRTMSILLDTKNFLQHINQIS